jgi:hypothetical protein
MQQNSLRARNRHGALPRNDLRQLQGRLQHLLAAARDDTREEAHARRVGGGEEGGGEGELAQEGVIADDLGEVGEGADVCG